MAFQNAQRRPTRTLMLVAAVAVGCAAVFASYMVSRGIAESTERSFARMGADLIVVPEKTMVNITSALLTVQPTEESMPEAVIDQIRKIEGVGSVAQQTFYRAGIMAGMPQHRANVIAFDPATDFTVMPWLSSHAPGAFKRGDLIAGARRAEDIGEEIQPWGAPANVYGKLGRSNVGPFDESLFTTYDTVAELAKNDPSGEYSSPKFDPKRVSALLLRLKTGATPEQIRFAIAQIPGVKVVQGSTVVTSTRQSTTILFGGMIAFALAMLLGSLLLVALLFSAIIAERRREIGVLQAIGAKRADVITMLTSEAAFCTGLGGMLGVLLGGAILFVFQNSLVYYLQTLHVEFIWPAVEEMVCVGAACLAVSAAVGMLAALLPAMSITKEEVYSLIQREEAAC